MKTRVDFCPPKKEIEFLEKKLFQHNRREIGPYEYDHFIIKSLDDSGSMTAGIHCRTGGGWLYIESLWVDEDLRGRGMGKQLLDRAEEIAVQKNCTGAYLYTYSFQSPGFYEKNGYGVFGTLEHFCEKHSKLYMKKRLV